MGQFGLSSLLRYAGAAVRNPRAALGKSGLVASRVRRHFSIAAPQPVAGFQTRDWPDLTALLDDLGKVLPVVLLSHEPRVAHIGLPIDAGLSVLNQLMGATGDVYVGGRPLAQIGRGDRLDILNAGRADVIFREASGAHAVLSVDLYEDRGAGLWVSLNTTNTTARALYDWGFAPNGLTPVADVIKDGRAPTLPRPVDVVFTWVNHDDPDWQSKFAAYDQGDPSLTDNRSITRFRNNGELRFALRSVARFMPWVRHVFIVSNCTPPDWLNTKDPDVTWVDHNEILPADALPTFNSHAIETALHKIPNLSEEFIYFNDDMFVLRPLSRDWFFGTNGVTHAHMEPYGMVTGGVNAQSADYLNASRNSAGLMVKRAGIWPTQLHQHVPYALTKTILNEIEAKFQADVARTRMARFRTPDDINMTSFLYHHFAWAQRRCTFRIAQSRMIKSTDLRWRDDLVRARREGLDVMCLNEGGRAASEPEWQAAINRALPELFAWAARWETAHDDAP